MAFRYIFWALWLTLVAYWILSAWGNKRTVYRVNPAWRLLALVALVALIAVFKFFIIA